MAECDGEGILNPSYEANAEEAYATPPRITKVCRGVLIIVLLIRWSATTALTWPVCMRPSIAS